MSSSAARLAHSPLQSPSVAFEERSNMCPVKLGPAGDLTLSYKYFVGADGVQEEDLLINVHVKGGGNDVNVSASAAERGLPDAFQSVVRRSSKDAPAETTGTLPVRLENGGLGYLRVPVDRDVNGQCREQEHAVLVQLRRAKGRPSECVVSGQFLADLRQPDIKTRSQESRKLRLAAG